MADVPDSLLRCATEIEGWLELGCPDRALVRVDRLLAHPGGRAVGLRFRAAARIGVEDFAQALGDLTELRRHAHDLEELELQEAWCRKRLDDLDGAIGCMRRLLETNRRSAIGHYNLACYLALRGDTDEALERLTHACGLDPQFRDLLAEERDFDNLRDDPLFSILLPPAPDPDGIR